MSLPTNILPTTLERQPVAINCWYVEARPGIRAQDVLDPDFWVHLARRFRVNDRVEIVAQDGSFDIELRVVAIDPRKFWAQMRPLRVLVADRDDAALLPADRDDPDGYKFENDPVHKWRIIDRAGNVVEKGMPDRDTAVKRLAALKAEKAAPKAA